MGDHVHCRPARDYLDRDSWPEESAFSTIEMTNEEAADLEAACRPAPPSEFCTPINMGPERYQNMPEIMREYGLHEEAARLFNADARVWREEHKAQLAEQVRERRKKNPEHFRAIGRRWYRKNSYKQNKVRIINEMRLARLAKKEAENE